MTRQELETKMNELKEAAKNLDEPDKTFSRNEIRRINMDIQGMALDEIRRKLDQIKLPTIEEMDEKIAAAKDATASMEVRVQAFNAGIRILKGALGFVL
jgi:hypothetical protein